MTLRHWEPAREMEGIQRAMDRLLDSFGQPFRYSLLWDGGNARQWLPLDVYEAGGALIVKADVPGLKPEDVTVEVTGNMLSIRGEQKDEREDKAEGRYIQERRYGSFHRSIGLPDGLSTDKVEASFENGVLTVHIPKSEAAKTRTVKIVSKK